MNKTPLIIFVIYLVVLVLIIFLSLSGIYHNDDVTFSLTWVCIIAAALSFPFIPKD